MLPGFQKAKVTDLMDQLTPQTFHLKADLPTFINRKLFFRPVGFPNHPHQRAPLPPTSKSIKMIKKNLSSSWVGKWPFNSSALTRKSFFSSKKGLPARGRPTMVFGTYYIA